MNDCEQIQQRITEEVSLSGREPHWKEASVADHVAGCAACRELLEQELELSRLLDEPLPLPPAGLIPDVMALIATDTEAALPARPTETGLPWAERFAWAASGAVAMFCLERLPSMSADLFSEAQLAVFSLLSSLAVPFEINGLYLAVVALGLLAAQGAMIYQVRASAS